MDQHGHAIEQRSISDIGVACDPATVGRAPVDVVGLGVESDLGGQVGVYHVANRRMNYAFWGASRTAKRDGYEKQSPGLILSLSTLQGGF